MPLTLQLKRGLEANRSNYTPLNGELIYCTDSKKLYVGDGTTPGGVEVSSSVSGVISVSQGGTGISNYTVGNYLRAATATTLEQRTPSQVLSDIGAASISHNHTTAQISDLSSNVVTLTSNQIISGTKTFSSIITSNLSTGTAPLNVSSTTLVSNLNVDMVDGYHANSFSLTTHNHDSSYSPITHNHDASYSPITHNHDASYSPITHNHTNFLGNVVTTLTYANPIIMNGATTYTGVVTLTGNTTFRLDNIQSGQVYRIIFIQDSTGNRTISSYSFFTGVGTGTVTIKWAGGTTPTLTTTANKVDIITILCVGTTAYADFVTNF